MTQTGVEKMTEWLESLKKKFPEGKKRVNLLVLLGIAGMILLCISEWIPESTAVDKSAQPESVTAQADTWTYVVDLEQRLQDMIEAVEGAGRCRVMVTLSAGEETVYAVDTEQGDTSSRSEHVLMGDEALVERIQTPEIQGVAVLCEGGGEAAVKNNVTELVRALTGIGANHITVTKMVTEQ